MSFDDVGRPRAGLARRDGPETMHAAAVSLTEVSGRLRIMVLDAVERAGDFGLTDDELERRLGLRHQTASARRRELVLSGHLVDSGSTRRTRSGRQAIVWVRP